MPMLGSLKLAHFSLRYPRTIISFWVAFFIVSGCYGLKLPDVLKDHGLTPVGGDYAYVKQAASADFHIPDAPVILVFENSAGSPEAMFRQFISRSLALAAELEGIDQVTSPLEREGMLRGNYAYALLALHQKPYLMGPVLEALRSRLPTDSGMSVTITGTTAVQDDVNRASKHDLKQAELIGLPAALLILWFAFGGVLTALIPVVLGIVSVAGAMGIMYGIGTRIELSNFVLNVIPMVGLALSIDFALILVSRFREELSRSTLPLELALRHTMATAGKSILLSAGCVLLGLTGMLWIPLPLFMTVTLGAMTVIVISTLLTFTLLPSLLLLLGPWIEAEARRKQQHGGRGWWASWAGMVMKRPLLTLLLASCFLGGCLLPLADMKLVIPDASSLPQGYASRQAMEVFRSHFEPPSSSRVEVLIEGSFSSGQRDLSDWQHAYAFAQRLAKDSMVLRVDSIFSRLGMTPKQILLAAADPRYALITAPFLNHNRMMVYVTLNEQADSKQAMDWVRRWARQGAAAELPYRLGGEVKYQQEVFDTLRDRIPGVLLFITASNYLILFIAFRSVLIPIKAILMNFLSLGAAFGLLTWMFRHGLFRLEPYDIAIMIPLFIFGLVFGMSMDYGIFLLSRIAESYERTGHNELAVREGLQSTSRVITSAAAIMIAVTAPFAFGEVVGVKQLGIGIAAAIAIDATVIRLIVVPSFMKLLGHWNWWSPGQHRVIR